MGMLNIFAFLCLYPIHGHVVNVNNDIISVKIDTGNVYDFYGDGYVIGDNLTLIIDGNNAVIDAR